MLKKELANVLKYPVLHYVARRNKSTKLHWSKEAKKKTSTSVALDYFDDLYGNVFGKYWPSMRVAMLTQSKYIALVNNYSDTDRIISQLENLGAVDVRRVLDYQVERSVENENESRKLPRKKAKSNRISEKRASEALESVAARVSDEEQVNIYPESSGVLDTTRTTSTFDSTNRLIDPTLSNNAGALYDFVPTTKLKGKEDWVPESQHFGYYNTGEDNLGVLKEEQSVLEYPSELKVYSFITGCCDSFPPPKRSPLLGVSDYYLMDGGSLLPILALDLKPGDNFLDMCAAPGGKSLIALQTLYANLVTMNDSSLSRCNRIRRVMNEFIFNFSDKETEGTMRITNLDGRSIEDGNIYNKILVDVPCTTDRHSVMVNDNNIFKSNRIHERIKIPEIQSSLLASAFKLVKVGGTVVYSTCSLSPIQNDGVVHMALKIVNEQSDVRMAIIDMTKALKPTKVMYKYRSNFLRHGHLVVPYLPDNYGPTYFCKFVRLE